MCIEGFPISPTGTSCIPHFRTCYNVVDYNKKSLDTRGRFLISMEALTEKEIKLLILKALQTPKRFPMPMHRGPMPLIIKQVAKDTPLASIKRNVVDSALLSLLVDRLISEDNETFSLTVRGMNVLEKGLDIDKCRYRLTDYITREDLLLKCSDDFDNQKYEDAIFKAFKYIEEQVRKKSGAKTSDFGTKLMTIALTPNTGKLVISSCQDAGEEDGVHSLFRGAYLLFKNPSSHRTVDYDNPKAVIRIIMFAELLLDYIDMSKLRK
jgi:uncharacterized protein (TIGR02391 family)